MQARIAGALLALALVGGMPAGQVAAHAPDDPPDGPVAAHGGGLDQLGCHHDRQLGGYHCHQGELAGLSFGSQAEAIAALTTCPALGLADLVTHVRDGDTIEVGTLPIRLQGLAAPERNERGGPRATRAMRDLVLEREVWCDLDGERSFDRCSAICYVGVRDVAAVMVHRGLARDCRAFSGGRYERLELAAEADGANIRRIYQLPGYCR